MPKNKGVSRVLLFFCICCGLGLTRVFQLFNLCVGKGGKNVKRGKNGNMEENRRDLLYKEFGQGAFEL